MSKPIILTEEIIAEMTAEFSESLRNKKIADGNVTYKKDFVYKNDEQITVWFTPVAFSKMVVLLQHFSTEVAWHGVVSRVNDGFVISDIFVYPQKVDGTNVNTDQEEYQKWLMEFDDDMANKLLMQGHSHVNMSTSPSVVDTNHQEQILAQLGGDNFYIFMIWNKRLENTIKVYDLASNTLYEDNDVTVSVTGSDFDLETFINDADSSVKSKPVVAHKSSYYGSGYYTSDGYKPKGGSDGSSHKTTHYLNYDREEQIWNQHCT